MPKHMTESTGASITAEHQFTTGRLEVDNTARLETSFVYERTSGTGVTVDGVWCKDGNVVLSSGNYIPVTSGGTGASTAAIARTNLGAAASGANTDITSLSGLTTWLPVTQGGTGRPSLTSGGILYGNGVAAVQVLPTSTSGYELHANSTGDPRWTTPIEYIAIICNSPSTSNSAVSDIARFQFPFNGKLQSARCGVSTAPTGTTFAVDVRNGATSFFTTTMRMNSGEVTSATATTPTVVNAAANTFSAWDTARVHFDSEGVSSKGMWITLVCVRTD